MKSERIGKMPNKLKDIFSDVMSNLDGKIYFEDNEAHNQFLEALQIVWDEGRAVEVKGVIAVETVAKYGDMVYPFFEQDEVVTNFEVAPSQEIVPFKIETEYGEKTISFKRYHTTNETIFETDDNEVVYIKINPSKNTFTFRVQPQLARTIKDIVENSNTAITLLNNLTKVDNIKESSDEYAKINDVKKTLLAFELFYSRLHLLEQELGLSFEPAKINDSENDQMKIEELHLLLVENLIIRLNAKLTATESTGITIHAGYRQPEVGSKLDITFLSAIEYIVYGQKISIHTANLLSNAIVKQFEENEDGGIKILYDDTDSQPMYISYRGFKTIDEAEQEMKTIMEHREKYTDALTFNEHMKEVSKRF